MCPVLWHITLQRRSSGFHVCHTQQTYSHTHSHTCPSIDICGCVCACILCCRCRFRLAQRNLFLAQLWRGEGARGGKRRGSVTDGRSQPRRSRVEPIRTSGGTHSLCLSSAQSLPLPRESERALYLTLSLSLCQSVSLPPWLAACAGIKCIPHEWIPEIRDGSQRVRCLTWIKAKSLAAAAAGGAPCPLYPLPRGREVPLLAHINPTIHPTNHQCCRHS